jgi:hypothetical protein
LSRDPPQEILKGGAYGSKEEGQKEKEKVRLIVVWSGGGA